MTELNKYSLYGLNFTNASKVDELDDFVRNIGIMRDYNKVKDFLENKWQDIDGYKSIAFPDLDKSVTLKVTDDRIEVRVFKASKQTFGQYWQIVSSNEE